MWGSICFCRHPTSISIDMGGGGFHEPSCPLQQSQNLGKCCNKPFIIISTSATLSICNLLKNQFSSSCLTRNQIAQHELALFYGLEFSGPEFKEIKGYAASSGLSQHSCSLFIQHLSREVQLLLKAFPEYIYIYIYFIFKRLELRKLEEEYWF